MPNFITMKMNARTQDKNEFFVGRGIIHALTIKEVAVKGNTNKTNIYFCLQEAYWWICLMQW